MGPVLISFHRSPAHRTDRWQKVGACSFRTLLHNDRQNLWYDLPCFPNQNCVANANILFRNKILIMQSRAGHRSTGEPDRLQYCFGKQGR